MKLYFLCKIVSVYEMRRIRDEVNGYVGYLLFRSVGIDRRKECICSLCWFGRLQESLIMRFLLVDLHGIGSK
jgi:hypothetical protein